MPQTAKRYYTPEEYLSREEGSLDKHEYFRGEIYVMAGGSVNHNRLARNTCNALTQAFGSRPCEAFIGDVRLLVKQNGLYTYPDVMALCGDPAYVPGRTDTITNPALIIEILSDSTRIYDSTDKFDLYKDLDTLHHYILLDQDRIYAQVFQRAEGRKWLLESYNNLAMSIPLPTLGVELALEQLYHRVEFPPPALKNGGV